MSTDKGYIKLYRDIRDHWIWSSEGEPFDKLHAWVDILMMVNHKDREVPFNGRMVIVRKGSRITSLHKLSERWHWSIHKVSDFLNLLEEAGMITQERNSKKTLINVVNYGFYQDSTPPKGTVKEQSRNSEGTLKEQSRNTEGTKQYIEKHEEYIEKNEEEEEPSAYDPLAGVRKRYDDL